METGRDHWQITDVMRLSLEDKNSKLTRTKPFEKKMNVGRHYFNILCWTFSLRVSFGVKAVFSTDSFICYIFRQEHFKYKLLFCYLRPI